MPLNLEKKQTVSIGSSKLEGILRTPPNAIGIVVFAHGAGSSRLSPRNNYVATCFAERGLATLLFDLLTETEALDRSNVFDVQLLGGRLLEAIRWVKAQPDFAKMKLGLFGASTGAAATLVAAAQQPENVAAIVSRGGRPDLAGGHLPHVKAPTLLIVGGEDHIVIDLNKEASRQLHCAHNISLVPEAAHLFEEPGTLDQVVGLAAEWFELHMNGSIRE